MNEPEAEVEAWLLESYPAWPIRARQFSIRAYPPPKKGDHNYSYYKRAFSGGTSRLHGWLKWFAYCHLKQCGEYEVELWIPPVLGRTRSQGSRFKGRVLLEHTAPGLFRRNINDFLDEVYIFYHQYPVDQRGRFLRADVAGVDRTYEVGATSPTSIVEPLWSYAVRRVTWIPFPIMDINTDWTDFSVSCTAFSLERGSRRQ